MKIAFGKILLVFCSIEDYADLAKLMCLSCFKQFFFRSRKMSLRFKMKVLVCSHFH